MSACEDHDLARSSCGLREDGRSLFRTSDHVERVAAPHELGLLAREEYPDAFACDSKPAGSEGLSGRGLYIGSCAER